MASQGCLQEGQQCAHQPPWVIAEEPGQQRILLTYSNSPRSATSGRDLRSYRPPWQRPEGQWLAATPRLVPNGKWLAISRIVRNKGSDRVLSQQRLRLKSGAEGIESDWQPLARQSF